MRVYQFSKQYGIPSKELLDALHAEGFAVGNHMSVLTPEEVSFLNKKFKLAASHADSAESKEAAPVPVQHEKVEVHSHSQNKLEPVVKEEILSIDELDESPVQQKIQNKPAVFISPFTLEPLMVSAVAEKLRQPVADVIITLLRWGIVAPKNHVLPEAVIVRLAQHYGVEVIKASEKKISETGGKKKGATEGVERMPIVVVMGHVDHGKTTLLDYIRKTRVASREKGGITQHLGAYEAATSHGNIVFIDTPGHEAFSKIRMRGSHVADIAILVVAADDGIMPQTVEAINHAKAAGLTIIVAINKMDRVPKSRLEEVKRQLIQYELLPEEWGGSVVVVPISAKEGTGVEQLLEMISLQAQLMELRAQVTGPAHGYILEAKVEKGRGPVATLLCYEGTLSVGDFFFCGNTRGKVNQLVTSNGKLVRSVLPSVPVQVAGFDELPEAGDSFEVVSAAVYKQMRRPDVAAKQPTIARMVTAANAINIILKTDTRSSREAILESLAKVSKGSDKKYNVIHSAVGNISESDISLAVTTGSFVIGLHVKVETNAAILAQKNGVVIENFDIIYSLLDKLKEIAESRKEIKMVRIKIGEAVVRRVFDIKGLGVIAGCYVKDGRFSKDGIVTVWRGNRKIGQGPIKSLQRDKKSVKEVHAGFECGFLVDGLQDWQEDDRIECFLEVPEGTKLK